MKLVHLGRYRDDWRERSWIRMHEGNVYCNVDKQKKVVLWVCVGDDSGHVCFISNQEELAGSINIK